MAAEVRTGVRQHLGARPQPGRGKRGEDVNGPALWLFAVIAAACLSTACGGGATSDPRPTAVSTSAVGSAEPQLGLCERIVFEGRTYVVEPRPPGTEAGVGAELGIGTAHHCGSPGAWRVKIYSVNEQPKEEAVTVSDTEHVWVYDAVR